MWTHYSVCSEQHVSQHRFRSGHCGQILGISVAMSFMVGRDNAAVLSICTCKEPEQVKSQTSPLKGFYRSPAFGRAIFRIRLWPNRIKAHFHCCPRTRSRWLSYWQLYDSLMKIEGWNITCDITCDATKSNHINRVHYDQIFVTLCWLPTDTRTRPLWAKFNRVSLRPMRLH